MMPTPTHIETIRCPECGKEQDAEVMETWPWWMRCHLCVRCGYVIMEGEWQRVNHAGCEEEPK